MLYGEFLLKFTKGWTLGKEGEERYIQWEGQWEWVQWLWEGVHIHLTVLETGNRSRSQILEYSKGSNKISNVTWWEQVRSVSPLLATWKINWAPVAQEKQIGWYVALVPALLKLFKKTLECIMSDSDCFFLPILLSLHLRMMNPNSGCMCPVLLPWHQHDIDVVAWHPGHGPVSCFWCASDVHNIQLLSVLLLKWILLLKSHLYYSLLLGPWSSKLSLLRGFPKIITAYFPMGSDHKL